MPPGASIGPTTRTCLRPPHSSGAKWGAWEVVGRYSHVDVADSRIDGGIFDRETLGPNWWATRRWKLGVDYGVVTLDHGGMIGLTNVCHTGIQWIY